MVHDDVPATVTSDPSRFLTLLQFCDTALPIGAYSLSNGLETYTQQGHVYDAATLQTWLETVLRHVVHGSHLLPIALAYRAASAADWGQIERLDQRLTAMKHARELRETSIRTGQSLLRLAGQVWPGLVLDHLLTMRQQGKVAAHHALVLGVLGCELRWGERVTVEAAAYQWLSGMVSVALRLLPLGQRAGQQVLSTLLTSLPALATDIHRQDWDDLFSAAPEFDIRAMQHETLYSRLFQS
jgi:urease accessory protein